MDTDHNGILCWREFSAGLVNPGHRVWVRIWKKKTVGTFCFILFIFIFFVLYFLNRWTSGFRTYSATVQLAFGIIALVMPF